MFEVFLNLSKGESIGDNSHSHSKRIERQCFRLRVVLAQCVVSVQRLSIEATEQELCVSRRILLSIEVF
jgi:hypothetical protein